MTTPQEDVKRLLQEMILDEGKCQVCGSDTSDVQLRAVPGSKYYTSLNPGRLCQRCYDEIASMKKGQAADKVGLKYVPGPEVKSKAASSVAMGDPWKIVKKGDRIRIIEYHNNMGHLVPELSGTEGVVTRVDVNGHPSFKLDNPIMVKSSSPVGLWQQGYLSKGIHIPVSDKFEIIGSSAP